MPRRCAASISDRSWRDRAEAALHGVGQQLGGLLWRGIGGAPRPPRRAEPAPTASRARITACGIRRVRSTTTCRTLAGCLVVGDEEVEMAVGIGAAPNTVSTGGLDAGHHGVWSRVEETRDHQLIRRRPTVGEQDGRGQQELPRATRATSVRTPFSPVRRARRASGARITPSRAAACRRANPGPSAQGPRLTRRIVPRSPGLPVGDWRKLRPIVRFELQQGDTPAVEWQQCHPAATRTRAGSTHAGTSGRPPSVTWTGSV